MLLVALERRVALMATRKPPKLGPQVTAWLACLSCSATPVPTHTYTQTPTCSYTHTHTRWPLQLSDFKHTALLMNTHAVSWLIDLGYSV